VLIAQHYSLADAEAHLRDLLPYFHDPRYIRIYNKPLFLVYRASNLPHPRATTEHWCQLAQQYGLDDLYLLKVESIPTDRTRHPELDGFGAALDFQPEWGSLPPPLQSPLRWKLLNKLGMARPHPFRTNRVFS
jgi:hypothetical protein